MKYVVVGTFLGAHIEGEPAESGKQACDLAQVFLDRGASNVGIIDLALKVWDLANFRRALEGGDT
jgi:hypothetical protein